ncbi:MAG: glycosyltransferase family 4 protein [Candidatus Magasanikbacteria bacterium]|nr:glycosyltransferase family 4 protein [Candidatus Magasanikbacteria bacterium]
MNQNKDKILLLTLEYPPIIGGVSRYYANLVNYFGEEKIKVLSTVLVWLGWPKWLPSIFKTLSVLRGGKFKRLFIGQVLPLGYVALVIKKFYKIDFVVFTHGMDILLPQKNSWKKWWLKKILIEAKEVIANSNFTKIELLKLGLADKKIRIIYPCVKNLAERQEFFKEGNLILSVGRLVARKGFDLVIKSLPQVLSKIPQARLVLIGEGPEKNNLIKITKGLCLEKNITLLGKIDDKELNSWFQKASVFIMPCKQKGADVEGLGTVFLEAASHGLPLVVGKTGGAPEAVIDHQTGILVDPNSLDEISEALINILADKNRAQKMGEEGRQLVEEKFLCPSQFQNLDI